MKNIDACSKSTPLLYHVIGYFLLSFTDVKYWECLASLLLQHQEIIIYHWRRTSNAKVTFSSRIKLTVKKYFVKLSMTTFCPHKKVYSLHRIHLRAS